MHRLRPENCFWLQDLSDTLGVRILPVVCKKRMFHKPAAIQTLMLINSIGLNQCLAEENYKT